MIAILAAVLLTPPGEEGACFWTRGELFAANGTPSFRIRVEETRRLLGVTTDEGSEAPDVLPANAREALESEGDVFMTVVSGDWRVCPLEPERAGSMRSVELVDARELVVRPR